MTKTTHSHKPGPIKGVTSQGLERVLLQDSALTRQCSHWSGWSALKVAALTPA